MTKITSIHNPRIKDALRLRDAGHRREQGRIIIDGARELRRAIAGGVTLHEVYTCPSLWGQTEAADVMAQVPAAAEIIEVAPPVFEKLAFGQRAQGLLGVGQTPARSLAELALPANPLVAVLEGVEKPGNVGAVLRSADAAGVSALIVADPRTDLYNPNAIRASLGTIFSVPVCQCTAEEARAWLAEQGLALFAARVEGAVPYTAADYRGPTALVLGSEAQGLTAVWSGAGLTAIRLPMRGVADSLNVSVTAAVLFYEALRQRTPDRP